ncbi:hypothetical protein [Winogradskyella sp.]|uniref:hypothetical protein n=1 Tax=Winogradskyella sp. TaxID=1883156 RepID=UPI0035C870C3
MKVCIISGRHPITEFDSATNHRLYADFHGYNYIHCNFPTKAFNPYFNKIYYILYYIDFFDYLIWIDVDAFFIDFSKDIMQFAPKDNKFLSACRSPDFKELKTFLSSGQLILKCNNIAKEFLKKVITIDLKIVKEWWFDELGFFPMVIKMLLFIF